MKPLDKELKKLITSSEFQDYLYSDPNECVDAILIEVEAHINKRVVEARNKGGIEALSHVLVYGATGRKHIGISRPYVVSYLAELQQDRRDLWEAKGGLK